MKTFQQFIEGIAALGVDDGKKFTDQIILRQAIIAELDAINLYEQMARTAKNKKVKSVLLDIAQEEKVHVGEFELLLDELDKEHKSSVLDGKEEAKTIK